MGEESLQGDMPHRRRTDHMLICKNSQGAQLGFDQILIRQGAVAHQNTGFADAMNRSGRGNHDRRGDAFQLLPGVPENRGVHLLSSRIQHRADKSIGTGKRISQSLK